MASPLGTPGMPAAYRHSMPCAAASGGGGGASASASSRPGGVSQVTMATTGRPSAPADVQAQKKMAEEALKAERLWWSEASSKQMEELEARLSEESQRVANRLRADVASLQDRLELLVHAEKEQRHASFSELRRDIDHQQLAIDDLRRQRALAPPARSPSLEATSSPGEDELRGLVLALNKRLDEHVLRQEAKTRDVASECAEGMRRSQAAEAQLADMRRDILTAQEWQQSRGGHLERRLEELNASFGDHRVELARVRDDLLRRPADGPSADEVHALRNSFSLSSEELSKRLEETSSSLVSLRRSLESASREAAEGLAGERAQRGEEASSFGKRLDALRQQLDEVLSAGGERTHRLEERFSKELEEERSVRVAELSELKHYVDGFAGGRASTAPGTYSEAASTTSHGSGHRDESFADPAVLSALRAELGSVRLALQSCEADTKRISATAARAEGEAQSMSERLSKYAGILSRVDALEEDVRHAAREHDIRRLDRELQRLQTEVAPLSPQVDAVQAETRKSARDLATEISYLGTTMATCKAEVAALRAHALPGSVDGVASNSITRQNSGSMQHAQMLPFGAPQRGRPSGGSPLRLLSPSRRSGSPQPSYQMPNDLSQKISSLVHKVKNLDDSQRDVSTEDGSLSRTANSVRPGSAVRTPVPDGSNYMKALQAVSELREQNMSLREENAELAGELLQTGPHSQMSTPGGPTSRKLGAQAQVRGPSPRGTDGGRPSALGRGNAPSSAPPTPLAGSAPLAKVAHAASARLNGPPGSVNMSGSRQAGAQQEQEAPGHGYAPAFQSRTGSRSPTGGVPVMANSIQGRGHGVSTAPGGMLQRPGMPLGGLRGYQR
eukprot:TRINITY_DN54786_c0_g1_i1.p1 TRINITY_DN54786_c0_g1~~TRINITY_DN54786_c0_g1_i1.p1  ORF type:complete len:848 (-),score=211.11 TRINITY_DN54786_c0_g1_i1:137-2680(-)